MKKFRIQGKVYTVVEELPNVDPSMIAFMYKIINSKKEEFTLIKAYKKYTLYKDGKVFAKTYSIKELA